jgi:hypothetical protein
MHITNSRHLKIIIFNRVACCAEPRSTPRLPPTAHPPTPTPRPASQPASQPRFFHSRRIYAILVSSSLQK